jgi:ElaB/YqjD/DUF883 family membrane-anchored ribosome-binding protein
MSKSRNGTASETSNLKAAAREAARRAQAIGDVEVENLIVEVEGLIDRLGSSTDPQVASLCTKVADAVASAKRSLNARATQVQRQARDAMAAGDTYVHDQPWQAISLAAVAGLLLGLMVYRR